MKFILNLLFSAFVLCQISNLTSAETATATVVTVVSLTSSSSTSTSTSTSSSGSGSGSGSGSSTTTSEAVTSSSFQTTFQPSSQTEFTSSQSPTTTTTTNPQPIISATTIYIVTFINGTPSTILSTSTPTSTSSATPSLTADQDLNSSEPPSGTSIVLYIFLGIICAMFLAAAIIYTFRCISLSPSEPFRKRLSNTDPMAGMLAESNRSNSSSRHANKTLNSERVVYSSLPSPTPTEGYPISTPRGPSYYQTYPSALRPMRHNHSSSTLASIVKEQQSSPADTQVVDADIYIDPHNYHQHPFADYGHHYKEVQYYDQNALIPVIYEDGSVGYVQPYQDQVPESQSVEQQHVPVIVEIGSSQEPI